MQQPTTTYHMRFVYTPYKLVHTSGYVAYIVKKDGIYNATLKILAT